MIPDDVTIQVLTQAREHIIKKTFEAISGAKNAVVHVYNSAINRTRESRYSRSLRKTSRRLQLKVHSMLKELAEADEKGNIMFEYSPESFTGTEPEYALEVM